MGFLSDLVDSVSDVLGGVTGGIIGTDHAEEAASQQAQAGQQAMALQREMFDISRQDRAPYAQFGQQQGLNRLTQFLNGNFERSPAYQFLRDEGMRGIEGTAAARGMLNSGRTLRELSRYTTGLASQEYGNQFNRLYNLATMGSNAASGNANAALQTGNSLAGLMTGIGNAQAAGQVGQANAASGFFNSILRGGGQAMSAGMGGFGG
jgi:hypothetical protein